MELFSLIDHYSNMMITKRPACNTIHRSAALAVALLAPCILFCVLPVNLLYHAISLPKRLAIASTFSRGSSVFLATISIEIPSSKRPFAILTLFL